MRKVMMKIVVMMKALIALISHKLIQRRRRVVEVEKMEAMKVMKTKIVGVVIVT